MPRSTLLCCDAPDCEVEKRVGPTDAPVEWYVAVIQVNLPEPHEGDGFQGWGWSATASQVEACTLEHLRIAMAVKIAEMTDEPAASS